MLNYVESIPGKCILLPSFSPQLAESEMIVFCRIIILIIIRRSFESFLPYLFVCNCHPIHNSITDCKLPFFLYFFLKPMTVLDILYCVLSSSVLCKKRRRWQMVLWILEWREMISFIYLSLFWKTYIPVFSRPVYTGKPFLAAWTLSSLEGVLTTYVCNKLFIYTA